MEEELEESETEALAKDDLAEREEGVPMQDKSESGKGTGHAKKAGDKTFNKSQLDEPTEEELEATETEEMAEDDPIVLKPPFSNESDDSSAHILVKVQDCRPSRGLLGAAPQLPRRTRGGRNLLLSDPYLPIYSKIRQDISSGLPYLPFSQTISTEI